MLLPSLVPGGRGARALGRGAAPRRRGKGRARRLCVSAVAAGLGARGLPRARSQRREQEERERGLSKSVVPERREARGRAVEGRAGEAESRGGGGAAAGAFFFFFLLCFDRVEFFGFTAMFFFFFAFAFCRVSSRRLFLFHFLRRDPSDTPERRARGQGKKREKSDNDNVIFFVLSKKFDVKRKKTDGRAKNSSLAEFLCFFAFSPLQSGSLFLSCASRAKRRARLLVSIVRKRHREEKYRTG